MTDFSTRSCGSRNSHFQRRFASQYPLTHSQGGRGRRPRCFDIFPFCFFHVLSPTSLQQYFFPPGVTSTDHHFRVLLTLVVFLLFLDLPFMFELFYRFLNCSKHTLHHHPFLRFPKFSLKFLMLENSLENCFFCNSIFLMKKLK